MTWSASKVFRAFETDRLGAVISWDLNAPSDSIRLALYDNDITPDPDATSANTAYNAGQWAISGNEVTDATGWAAKGPTLDSMAVTNPSSGVVMLDAADEVGAACTTGLTNVTGGLVFNDTATTPVADQGICYLYFGGSSSVGAGAALTVAFHANGLARWTV